MLTTNPFEFTGPDGDKLREECGVFGIYGHPEAAAHTALGLHALQHRGQEACGIVSFDGERFNAHRALGQVGPGEDGDHPRRPERRASWVYYRLVPERLGELSALLDTPAAA